MGSPPPYKCTQVGGHLNALVHFRCVIHGFFVCLVANFIVCLVRGLVVCLVSSFRYNGLATLALAAFGSVRRAGAARPLQALRARTCQYQSTTRGQRQVVN